MRLVKIEKLENGAHRNKPIANLSEIPNGWAVVPDDMVTDNFPFGDLTAEEIDGVMTVTSWTPGEIPEFILKKKTTPSEQDDTAAMLVDHEYRLTLLELGV